MTDRFIAPLTLAFGLFVPAFLCAQQVDFRKDIQPILAANCVQCHQGNAAPAELRLDTPEGLLKGGTSGKVLNPGEAEKSLLIARITDPNGNNRMPPGSQLTAGQIAAIKTWIDQGAKADTSVDFVSQIQPIFRSSCYTCHSGNDPKSQLHLDSKALALKGAASGLVIVAGNARDSRLVHRVRGEGSEPRMPLAGSPLTNEQIALIEKWINQGANWPDSIGKAMHWSYVKPARPAVPAVKDSKWARNAIDSFILARLEKEGLRPSPEATKQKLARRLYLDVIGIPPSPAEVDAFASDSRPDAYERLVDKLLASPQYGERMATPWLDLGRYGDSNGYERDFQRVAWPYRDWVIKSFNENKRFDQFTIEQLAGDLLPNATSDQRVATGFVRSSMLNTEGGTDPAEQNWVAQTDRAITVGNVWLGSTIQCSQCHNHKYDPFTQKQFYQMVAFFNNSKFEAGRTGGYVSSYNEPKFDLASADQAKKRDDFNAQIAKIDAEMKTVTPEKQKMEADWERSLLAAENQWRPLQPTHLTSQAGSTLTTAPDASILVSGANPDTDAYTIEAKSPVTGEITGIRIEALPDKSLPHDGPGRDYYGNFIVTGIDIEAGSASDKLSKIEIKQWAADNLRQSVIQQYEGAGRVWRSDVSRENTRLPGTLILTFEKPFRAGPNDMLRIRLAQLSQYLGIGLGKFRVSVTSSPDPGKLLEVSSHLRALLTMPREERSSYIAKLENVISLTGGRNGPKEDAEDPLVVQWRNVAPELAAQRAQIADLRRRIADLKITSTLVLGENMEITHPKAFMHERGAYTAQTEEVEANVPSFLGSLPKDGEGNRLSLARWLVSSDNPLTARVRVNQIWQMIFGMGIVETSEDFGTQGFPPSHPELLDWLATEFMSGGWDQKALVRLIVTSNAYRQSSKASPELLERDPKNALLARGPRFRVEAEMIRDISLATSGLLSLKLGGPPIMPPQPEGMWDIPFRAADDRWVTSQGEDRYRRGLYIFIRRTVRYPSLTVFDAPSRETTNGRRNRSNTPLQALTTLNDPAFFEAARAMAARIQREGGGDSAERVVYGFRLVTSRRPSDKEAAAILDTYESERKYFNGNAKEAEAICGKQDPELAAWTMVSNTLLNLDEALTKE